MIKRTVMISGAGPCGLAAALMFLQRGWQRIVVAENNASARTFDKNKGFNYLVDARGQKLLTLLGLTERLANYGVENQRNIMTLVHSDGTQKVFKSPFWDPARDSAFWIRRDSLQALLYDAIVERNDGRVELLYGHEFHGLDITAEGVDVLLLPTNESTVARRVRPDLILGCDGLRSSVREAMIASCPTEAAAFDRIRHPSPSSKLLYKVLSMPACIPLNGDMAAADNNQMAYAFLSRHSAADKAMALVAYPVASADEARTVNIIRLPDHALWARDSAKGVLDFLEDAFPQLPIRDLVSAEEAEDFVTVKAPKFPAPQYTRKCQAMVGGVPALLLGDAAHAFPPDLGLGVNTALEDVLILSQMLEAHEDKPIVATRGFEIQQKPERSALVKLVQSVAPYQYDQIPWRLKLWALKFFAVKSLHGALPWFVDRPAVLLAQQDELRFTAIRRRQIANRFRLGALLAAVSAALAVGLAALA